MEAEIKSYIEQALETENYEKYEIKATGSSEKADGYASHITFATVIATTREGIKKSIEIAIKNCKKNFINTFRSLYEREAYIYGTVIPEYTKFQSKNNIENIFNSFPKCYKSILNETTAVIIMENLRKTGYSLYDRKKPLDLNHLKLVLREYGKFHAISFAFREKRKDDFQKLTANFNDVSLQFFDKSFRDAAQHWMKRACNILKESNEMEAYEMCNKICEKTIDFILPELLENVEKETAILHSDCWNNNFMYKYESQEQRVPSKVAILDWQISRLHSPVLDLSCFVYTTSSVEQLEHFDELLNVYYTSFSTFLAQLGCDSEKLFPFSTLQRHWRKYSLFGVLITTTFLHVTICEDDDAPDIADAIDAGTIGTEITNVEIRNDVEYRRRLVAVLSHYCKYNSK